MRHLIAIAFLAAAAAAGEEEWRKELEAERKAREAVERRLAALEAQRSDTLRADVERYLEERDPHEHEHGGGGLVDISAILDLTAGGSTANDDELAAINLGDHDPRVRGFNVRNEELVVSAEVDPHLRGVLAVVYKISEEGESEFELEEAYGAATGLPMGFRFKVGQYFLAFGRTIPVHPHAWEFLNLPVILARVFGADGWRGQGAQLSWTAPGFPVVLLVGAQNARGETQASFLGEEGATVGAYTLVDRPIDGLADLVWNARAEAGHDLLASGGTLTALLGFSFGWGPNGTGPGADTAIWGVDLLLHWRPDGSDRPLVAWQTEVVWRRYDAAAQSAPMVLPAATYEDWGLCTQVVWAFRRSWTAGVRYDYADSDGAFPGAAHRLSLALTYRASERARIRLQLNWDRVEGIALVVPGADERSFGVWINFSLFLGAHAAHD